MALLFSKVMIQSDFNEVEFIVGGFPTEPDDMARCDEYQDFLDETDEENSICVHVDAYMNTMVSRRLFRKNKSFRGARKDRIYIYFVNCSLIWSTTTCAASMLAA